jgi:hypothetical protein
MPDSVLRRYVTPTESTTVKPVKYGEGVQTNSRHLRDARWFSVGGQSVRFRLRTFLLLLLTVL